MKYRHYIRQFSEARTSHWFVVGLALSIGGWIALNLIPGTPLWHFDIAAGGEKFNLLNFLLSIEASLSTPLLFMTNAWDAALEREEAAKDREKLDDILRTTKVLVEALILKDETSGD